MTTASTPGVTGPLNDGIDQQGSHRAGTAGRYYYFRPDEILVLEQDVDRVAAELGREIPPTGPAGPTRTGDNARGEQRASKRTGQAPFGVTVFGLEGETRPVAEVLALLTAAGITCDFNYVTAPTPMRSHAVSYAEPASVAQIVPIGDAATPRDVRVGVLDTGRPYYDDSFVDYYRRRFHALDSRLGIAGPLSVLNQGCWLASDETPGGGPLDRDTMVTSFGRLAHPHAGHGLFVGSIIARHAPRAALVGETTLSGDSIGDLYDMLVDLEHAASAGCCVLNMSMGFHTRDDACPPLLDRALHQLAGLFDTQVIASAGNDGTDRPSWPAAHDTVAAIAAVDAAGDGTDWSNFGDWVDACALGNEVVSEYPFADWDHPDGSARRFSGAAQWSGTSFSAPLVSALLATAFSDALAAPSAAAQAPRVRDVWAEMLGKAWDDLSGMARPDAATHGLYPYGPQLGKVPVAPPTGVTGRQPRVARRLPNTVTKA